MNILCIVAPYEADAQLAYLEMQGITDFTISEDSDLLIYGCKKVLLLLCYAKNNYYLFYYYGTYFLQVSSI